MTFSKLGALAAAVALSATGAQATTTCSSHVIPVKASAQNQVIYAPNTNLSDPEGVMSFLGSGLGALGQLAGFIPVSGTYNIAAKYCAPDPAAKAPASRANEVQLLLHGVPYNMTKSYWFGLPGNPDGTSKYDWVTYATSQGYPVLAIDNLGAGDSSRPDPVVFTQQPLQTEIVHQITQMLRAGSISFAPKASKVIFVGHSLASVIGNGIASHYPKDFDALVLTGYTYNLLGASLGLLATFLEPAVFENPTRFAGYDPGYLAFSNAQGKRNSYYGPDGSFSAPLAAYDFAHEDTISLGQIYSAFSGLQKAETYTGDVLVVTGDMDAFFCGDGSRAFGAQSCYHDGTNTPEQSKVFFPHAHSFAAHLPPNTSHATTLHYSTPDTLKYVHDSLAGLGY